MGAYFTYITLTCIFYVHKYGLYYFCRRYSSSATRWGYHTYVDLMLSTHPYEGWVRANPNPPTLRVGSASLPAAPNLVNQLTSHLARWLSLLDRESNHLRTVSFSTVG